MNKEQRIVMPLLATALFSMSFLFGVSYTNASWTGSERPLPELFAPHQISYQFDKSISIISENLAWSLTTSSNVAGEAVLNATVAFLGIDQGLFDTNPSQFAIARRASTVVEMTGSVLGASTRSSEYQAPASQ
jgi:hypothetical protein